MVDSESIALLNRYHEGDARAAEEIFARYVDRLAGLARSRLSRKLARKVDPEDVVQSAFGSFFRSANAGNFEVTDEGRLWSLLAKITLRKVYRQAERFSAAKQNVDQEKSVAGLEGVPIEQVAADPPPSDVNVITEELGIVLESLSELQRQMLELHLHGNTVDEIAEQVNRSPRTIRRMLSHVEQDLEERLA